MKRLRKIIAALLTVSMMGIFSGCGSSNNAASSGDGEKY